MSLLLSKIRPPLVPAHAIERPRLLDRILEVRQSVVVLHAPAGYGKSVLAAQVREREPKVTAWLHLEPEDAQPARFCRYVTGALAGVVPGLDRTELVRMTEASDFDPNEWVECLLLFFEEVRGPSGRLVLDNFESIAESDAIAKLLQRLVDPGSARLSLLLTSRVLPRLGLRRLAEQGKALLLGIEDLAFDLEEFQRAAQKRSLAVGAPELEELWHRTEGWCVFLGLEGSRPGSRGRRSDAAAVGYLEEELLGRLPAEERDFLRATSVLEVVSEESAAALGLDPSEVRDRIDRLGRSGIPVLSLAGGEGMRLHPVLRERLLGELRAPEHGAHAARLAQRAVEHLARRGEFDAAVRLLVTLEQPEAVLELLHAHWRDLEMQNLYPRLRDWLHWLPESVHSHPLYAVHSTRYHKFMGNHRALLESLAEWRASSGAPREPEAHPFLWVAENWARVLLAEGTRYDALRETWERLRKGADVETRIAGERMLAIAALYELRLTAAVEHAEEIPRLIPPGFPSQELNAANSLATVLHEVGRTPEAIAICESGIRRCEEIGETAYHVLLLLGQAFHYKDMGRYAEAAAANERSLEIARQSDSLRALCLPHVHRNRGEVLWQTGHHGEGLEALLEAYRLFQDENVFEALATGTMIDHWRTVLGQPSGLVTERDFAGLPPRSEARVRFQIRQGRAAAMRGRTEAALEALRAGREMASEMPSWAATTWCTEAWVRAGAGQPEESRRALRAGLELLARIDRPIYPLADPVLSGWVVTEAVAGAVLPEQALRLARGEGAVDLADSFRAFLEPGDRPADEIERVVVQAIRLRVRGLGELVRDSDVLSPERKQAYAAMLEEVGLPPVQVRLFGRFEVVVSGREARFERRASRRLLAMLLLEHPQAVHEERLLDALWPEADPAAARRNLQTSVNALRRALDRHHRPHRASYVEYRAEQYGLALPLGSRVDLHEVRDGLRALLRGAGDAADAGARRAKTLRLLDLVQGDLLADDPYEEFAAEPRERARALYQEGVIYAVRELLRDDRPAAVRLLERALEMDPLWGEGVAHLMHRLRDEGRVLAALRLYRSYEARLLAELGVDPDREIQDLFASMVGTA